LRGETIKAIVRVKAYNTIKVIHMAKARAKAFLSRSEVARLFHVSPITVARWADQGKLPYQVTLGGQRRYPREGTMAVLGEVARRAQDVRRSPAPRRTRATRARRPDPTHEGGDRR